LAEDHQQDVAYCDVHSSCWWSSANRSWTLSSTWYSLSLGLRMTRQHSEGRRVG
jgi:hypothetical protein